MRPTKRFSLLHCSAVVGAWLLSGLVPSSAATITYSINVDTSSIKGSTGFLDWSFAPGNDSQSAVVTISSFSTAASLNGAPMASGGVSGILPGNLTFDNSTQFNDYFQAFTYTGTIAFSLAFSGPALTVPDGTSSSGSTFGFAMFDASGSNPLLTSDPNGNAFTIDVNLDGSTRVTVFASDALGGDPVASVQAAPEPSTLLLLLVPLVGLAMARMVPRAITPANRPSRRTEMRSNIHMEKLLKRVFSMRSH